MKVKKKNKHLLSKIIGILSFVSYIVFSTLLLILDMVPTTYLIIFFVIFTIIYLILLILCLPKKIKKKIKIVSCVFLVIFGVIFGIGIKYLGELLGFFGDLNDAPFQREIYYVMVLEDSKIDNIKDLNNSEIGIYKSKNMETAIEKLQKEIVINYIEYENIESMFEALQDGKIKAAMITDSIKELVNTELSEMNLNLKEIYNIAIAIKKKDIVKIIDVTKEPFTIFLAGGDSFGSIDHVTNTDVNMLITVNPRRKEVLLTSIPRDYYVNLPSFGDNSYDKLTHAGYYGIEESVKAIEKLLDVDINYYVKVNFSTVVGVIDAIDGVDVNSDYSFCVTTTDVCVKKGMNHLTGYQAMMFARERKSFSDGDIQRVKNQQKVVEAIIDKVTSSTKIITNFSNILDSVSDSLNTNLDTKSINKFVKMQLKDMSSWDIESINLVGKNAYSTQTYTFPGTKLYVMEQDKESVDNAKNKLKEYLN